MVSRQQGVLRPQICRFKLGEFEVTSLLDGASARDNLPSLAQNAPPAEFQAVTEANRIDAAKFSHNYMPTLVDTGKELILFDTGNGTLARDIEAMRGRLPPGNLRAVMATAGYQPEDVDMVVITHGHPDHIGGLVDAGQEVFTKARYVFGAAEFDYWKRGENIREMRKGNQALFVKIAVPLAEKSSFVKPGDAIASGITAVDAAGHSAGMMAYHIESGGQRLLLWADTSLHYVVSLQRPEWRNDFDDNADQAVATRKRIFDMAASERIWTTGYHLPFPGVGHVERAGDTYRWLPMSYQLLV